MGADGNIYRSDATSVEKIRTESGVSRNRHRRARHRDCWNLPTDRSLEPVSGPVNRAAFIDDRELKQIDDARSGKNRRRRAWRFLAYETSSRALRGAAGICRAENARLPRIRRRGRATRRPSLDR